jgi:flavin reductase (DIM6/NTAB) family NADH-FMN oxidoreductase RutF
VIAVPTAEIARRVVSCGEAAPRGTDKLARARLTPLPASRVRAPLVKECYANHECRVHDARLARKYCFYVLRVVQAWMDPARKRPRTIHHMGAGRFMVAGRTLRLPTRAR